MRHAALWFIPIIGLGGCARLEQLPYLPLTTPEQWCERRPCVELAGTILNEPLGSVLVFLLAALWTLAGVSFLRAPGGQRARFWLGVALVLGGIGAAQAGISYQAFSYELKCAGREHCLLTNGFEVGYSLTQAFSVSAMLIAAAWACAANRVHFGLTVYALLNAIAYAIVTILGVLLPSATLLSFEVLTLFALPGIFVVIVLARSPETRSLRIAAVLLLAIQVAFFAYSAAGITAYLWDGGQGFYFSENDVLHIGMILWLIYVTKVVGRDLCDYETFASLPRNDQARTG